MPEEPAAPGVLQSPPSKPPTPTPNVPAPAAKPTPEGATTEIKVHTEPPTPTVVKPASIGVNTVPAAPAAPRRPARKAAPKRPLPAVQPAAPPAAPQAAAPSAAYFPAVQGQMREYQFFRQPGQDVGRKNRVVECLEAKTFPNGTVRCVIKTTVFAGGAYQDEISTDAYSAYGNSVEHTSHNDQPLTGRFLFKIPKPGGVERWLHQEKDGTIQYYKTTFSPLKADDRIFPDCLMVVEKTVKKTGEISLRYLYYARDKGLVRLEVYGEGLKIDRSASLDVVETAPPPPAPPAK